MSKYAPRSKSQRWPVIPLIAKQQQNHQFLLKKNFVSVLMICGLQSNLCKLNLCSFNAGADIVTIKSSGEEISNRISPILPTRS